MKDTAAMHNTDRVTTTQYAAARDVAEDRNASPILEALGYADDRLNRVDATTDGVERSLGRLVERLESILTDGSPAPMPGGLDDGANAPVESDVDRRSTIARNVAVLAHRADLHADRLAYISRRLDAIIAALEL